MTQIKYPKTRREDVIETRAGVEFPDPYRWLEAKTDEVLQWQRAQAKLAADYVKEWPHFDALKKLVGHFSKERFGSLPRLVDGKYFRTQIQEGASQAQVLVSDEPYSEGRVLFDPQVENPDTPPFVSWISPSPDGSMVAVGVCTDGSENNTIRLIAVDTGALMPDPPPQTLMDNWSGGTAWLPDSSGFYFSGLTGSPNDFRQKVMFHNLADSTQTLAELPFPDPESTD
jgi:prolyl oligopeptidase